MMTVEDVALRLKVSDSFVYGGIGDGRLKHHRVGMGQGGIRGSELQLVVFLKGTERGGEQAEVAKPRPPVRTKFTLLPPP